MQEPVKEAAAPGKAPATGARGRLWPLIAILVLAVVFFASGAHRYLSIDALKENYRQFEAFVAAHYFTALLLYMLAYVALAALSLPGASIMSMLGGFLFGAFAGTAAVVVSATFGATLIFLAARTALREFFMARAKGFIKKMEAGFSENAFSYLLVLRLIPLFPFFIVNIVPAFTQIRTRTFIAATLIGIIPGAFAFVSAGNGLGAIFARDGDIEFSGLLLQPEILTPIVALSLLALLPVIYRALRNNRETAPRS